MHRLIYKMALSFPKQTDKKLQIMLKYVKQKNGIKKLLAMNQEMWSRKNMESWNVIIKKH